MKEKILTAVVLGILDTVFVTACATAGSLFADSIMLRIREKQYRKETEKGTC